MKKRTVYRPFLARNGCLLSFFKKIADCILVGLKKDGSGNNNNDTGQDDEVFRCKAEDGQKKLINQECSENDRYIFFDELNYFRHRITVLLYVSF